MRTRAAAAVETDCCLFCGPGPHLPGCPQYRAGLSARDRAWRAERAGFVLSRRSRASGTVIGLYRSDAAGMESDPDLPWSTVCEDHGYLVCHGTRKAGEAAMAVPDWCEPCQAAMEARR